MKEFATKTELFRHLKDNKEALIATKKFELKKCDAICFVDSGEENTDGAETVTLKAVVGAVDLASKDTLSVKLIINTTNIRDSHKDVHFPGIWKKSIKDKNKFYLLKEHKMSFETIIADDMVASTQMVDWSKIGYNYEGKTQALVFTGDLKKDRNPYMFDQYAKGYVVNHSVGMRYVNLELAVNSTDKYYAAEKETYDKYINEIVNKAEVEEDGYFWAVTEAKLIEGSAVPVGSNQATPVLSIKEVEPSNDTHKEEDSHESTIEVNELKSFLSSQFKNLNQ